MRNPPSFSLMVLASFLFHLVVISLLLYLPQIPRKKIFYAPVMTVNLMAGGAVAEAKKGPEKAPVMAPPEVVKKEAPPKKVVEEAPKPPPVEEKVAKLPEPEVKSIPKRPEVIPLPPKVEPERTKPGLEAVEEAIRQRAYQESLERIRARAKTETPQPATPSPEVVRGEAGGEVAKAPGGRPFGRELYDLKFKLYYDALWERVMNAWVLPESLARRTNLETTISVKIGRDGTLLDSWIERSSGNSYYDDTAMRAVKKAAERKPGDLESGFPPLPSEYVGEHMLIGFRFHPTER